MEGTPVPSVGERRAIDTLFVKVIIESSSSTTPERTWVL